MRYNQLGQKKGQLIEHYKHKQELYKHESEAIEKQIQKAHSNLEKELASFSSTTLKINQKAKIYIQDCLQSLQQNHSSKETISIRQLADYLKLQKSVLKNLTNDTKENNQSQLNIHQVLIRAKFESTLKKIKKQQLEEEINYLETNVLSKGRLIYSPATAPNIFANEERHLIEKLQQSIAELQRVISLAVFCHQDSNQTAKLRSLEAQSQRLKQCQSVLASEYDKLGKMTKYFESYVVSIPERLPLPLVHLSVPINQPQKLRVDCEEPAVSELELDQIIGIELPATRSISRLCHRFDSCEERIDALRKKFKKFQKLL